MAVIAVILLKIIVYVFHPTSAFMVTVAKSLYLAILINLGLAFFNLIPIFPLDGGNILLGVLKGKALERYEKIVPYGTYIILALVMFGFVRYIIIWPIMIFMNIFL